MTNHQNHRFNNIIDKYINLCYICNRYLFIIYRDKRSTQTRGGASGIFTGVSSFLFCLGFGGVERGESTGLRSADACAANRIRIFKNV